MAVDKGKVKAALDAKFKGKSVSKELKDSIAARWADKIENEEGIDEYINDREDDILDAAKEADRRATAAAAKARQDAADAAAGKKPETDKSAPADELPPDTPEWAKALMQQNKVLAEKVEGFERQKQTETLLDRFNKDERVKGIPEGWRRGYIPTKDEDLETNIIALKAEWEKFATENKLSQFGTDAPAGGGKQAATGKKEATKEELDAVMPNLLN